MVFLPEDIPVCYHYLNHPTKLDFYKDEVSVLQFQYYQKAIISLSIFLLNKEKVHFLIFHFFQSIQNFLINLWLHLIAI